MRHVKTLLTGFAALSLAGAAIAQDSKMNSGSMSGSGMNKDGMTSGSMKMSKMDMRTMKSCQAMDHDAMMSSAKCKKLMAKHADMFNSDGSMKSGMMSH